MYLFIYLFEREERKITIFSQPQKVSVMTVVLSLIESRASQALKVL